jgi:hypothetical protein
MNAFTGMATTVSWDAITVRIQRNPNADATAAAMTTLRNRKRGSKRNEAISISATTWLFDLSCAIAKVELVAGRVASKLRKFQWASRFSPRPPPHVVPVDLEQCAENSVGRQVVLWPVSMQLPRGPAASSVDLACPPRAITFRRTSAIGVFSSGAPASISPSRRLERVFTQARCTHGD